MNELRYPVAVVAADAARAGFGFLLCIAVLSALPVAWFPFGAIAVLAIVFAGFGLLTLLRTRMRIVLSDEGLECRPGNRKVLWCDLSDVRLVYYSTRRDGEDGWLELKLRAGNGRSVRVDSRLDGFEIVVRAALKSASEQQLALDPATVHNVKASGLADPG